MMEGDSEDPSKILIFVQSGNGNVDRVPKILMSGIIIIFTSISKLFTRGYVSTAENNCVKGKNTEGEVKTSGVLRTRV